MNIKHVLVISLSLVLFISGCGGGKKETKIVDNNIPTEKTLDDQTTPETKSFGLRFNLSNAKTLITKEDLIQSVAVTNQNPIFRAVASTSGGGFVEQQPVFTYQIADSNHLASANNSNNGASNLLAIDEDGNAQLAIDTDGQIKVLYTVASPDGESIFIAIDNGWYNGTRSSEEFIAERNCAIYEVRKSDNSYQCVANGLYVQQIDDNYLKKISGNQKPIQFDADNNMYFTATSFDITINGTSCEDFETNDVTGEQRCLIQASETNQIWIVYDDWKPRIYKQDAITKKVTPLTQDNQLIDFFTVLSSGEVVTQYTDQISYKSKLNLIQGIPEDNQIDDQIIDLPAGNWGVDFFTVDNGNTVIFGSNTYGSNTDKNGIRFARPRPNGGTDFASLDTSLFGTRDDDKWISPKPYRVILGDNGRVYAVFEGDVNRGNGNWQNTLTVYQVLPHNSAPKLIINLPKNQDWWHFMDDTPFQISKGYLYYKETVEVDGYGTADVINIHNLETRKTKKLLDATKGSRYEIYNWTLSDTTLYFSALDKSKNAVVTGKIDTSKITEDDNTKAITINKSLSAIGAISAVRDIEIIPSKKVANSTYKSPEITKVYQDSENLFSMSVDFSHHMNHETIDSGLMLNSSENEGPNNDNLIPTLKVWVDKTLHLIPDLDGLGNGKTEPLTPDNTYTLNVAGDGVKDKGGKSLSDQNSHIIKMRPASGFYISSIGKSNEEISDAISSGSVLRFSANHKDRLQTFDLGNVPHNVRLEFSAKTNHWDSIGILYFDDISNNNDTKFKTLATINLGSFIGVDYTSKDLSNDWTSSFFTELFNDGWSRYRIDFYDSYIKIYHSTDGVEFKEKKGSEGSINNFVTRSGNNHHLYLQAENLMSFDNIEMIELDNLGVIKDSDNKILHEVFDKDTALPDKYKDDITEEKGLD